MIEITLKDGIKKQFEKGSNILEIAQGISRNLGKAATCGKINGEVVDLRTKVLEDCNLEILTFDDEEGRGAYRHTASHILAQAAKRLFPELKLAIGPSTDTGFYYDFDREKPFVKEEIEQIEKEMQKIIKEDLRIEHFILERNAAIKLMGDKGEHYKVELIRDLPQDAVISFYQQGDFVDLCAGPHLYSTKSVKSIHLFSETGSSGAYWRGNEKNKMLSRIYGTAFPKASILEAYLKEREEAVKRDHNKLGRELKIFTTSDVIGQGLPLFMPRGAKIFQTLQRFVEDEEARRGYVLTKTPYMAKSDLYKISGHWQHYKDGMFVLGDEEKDKEVLALRPMTCPFQYHIYNAEQHSYRDLPIRYAETSTLFRKEASGEMHGLIRVRQFTISEAHLVMTKEHLEEEFKSVISLINFMMDTLGISDSITYQFSKWDPNNKEKYEGDAETWEETQSIMHKLLTDLGINFKEVEGDAAFYGPKLDIQTKNVYGKEDTLFTVQIDFSQSKLFNMTYMDKDGVKKNPIIIHRTSIGCYERTIAMLIEKYAGAFPTWLAPVQVAVLPLSDKYADYADKVSRELKNNGILIETDHRAEKIGYKIREARNMRIPYILVVGEQEEKDSTVAVRSRKGDEGAVPLTDFITRIRHEIDNKIKDEKVEDEQK